MRSFFPFFLAAVVASSTMSRAAEKPDIVFFLIDDLGYADCGFNGGKDIRTPHIDALAKGGTNLAAHYVQPVCSPTRAALMTGRYATHTGVYTIVRPHAKWGLPLAERTLANALKEAGYTTAITGKWHLGEFDPAYVPTARGFDHQYGHYFGAIDYFTHIRDGSPDWYRDGQPLKEEGYSTELLAREACRLIEAQGKGTPLFLYVPFNGVHSPLQVPEKYLAPYANLSGKRKTMAGMLAAVDEAIGQVVAALEKAGRRKNTLIVFSADNGGPTSFSNDNGPLRAAKGTLYEGGVRAAAFANWPGRIPAGATLQEPMHIIDWYPTLVKLAGGALEQKLPLDGRDVWPMLTQGAKSPHESILLVQSPQRAAVRVGEWKLLMNASETIEEAVPENQAKAGRAKVGASGLYHLASDLGEKNDLSAQEPERVKAMQATLRDHLRDAVPEGQLGARGDAPKRRKKQP
jgi:arylsulfatase A-like enzyme